MIRDAGFVLEVPDGTALDAERLEELLATPDGWNPEDTNYTKITNHTKRAFA